MMKLSERSLDCVRLALVICAGWLWSAYEPPPLPLPLALGGICSALLAWVWVPNSRVVGVDTDGSSSRTSLFGVVYSLTPVQVRTAVGMIGAVTQSVHFVFEPVAAAIVCAVVFQSMSAKA